MFGTFESMQLLCKNAAEIDRPPVDGDGDLAAERHPQTSHGNNDVRGHTAIQPQQDTVRLDPLDMIGDDIVETDDDS